MKALLKRMSFDKLRCNDPEIRKVALECLHLLCAVDDDFDLHLEFPKWMHSLCLKELLLEYEEWEADEELIKISKNVRASLKQKMKEIKGLERPKEDVETKHD